MNKYADFSKDKLVVMREEAEKKIELLAFNSKVLRKKYEMRLCYINAALINKEINA